MWIFPALSPGFQIHTPYWSCCSYLAGFFQIPWWHACPLDWTFIHLHEIVHRPGKRHINADALSRLPETCVSSVTTEAPDPPTGEPTMLALQTADPDIATAARWLVTSVPPRGDPALQSVSPTVLALWQHSARLRLVDGLLYRIYDTPQDPINQLVVPTAARSDVMKALHNDASSAHLGITKTLDKARCGYYWPGMSSDIENWIRACPICQARQGPNPKQAARRRSQQFSFPLQRVTMDIMGPLPTTSRQNKYILVIGDYFTKWVEAFAMPDVLASTVARYFVDGFVCRYGVPLSRPPTAAIPLPQYMVQTDTAGPWDPAPPAQPAPPYNLRPRHTIQPPTRYRPPWTLPYLLCSFIIFFKFPILNTRPCSHKNKGGVVFAYISFTHASRRFCSLVHAIQKFRRIRPCVIA